MNNFRKHLITKCMGDAAAVEGDGDSLNEVLNGSADIDVFQLRSYTWRHVIPQVHRVPLYKQLLGIASGYRETRDVVEKHRREEVEVLLRCLQTQRSFTGSFSGDQPLPSNWDLVKMMLLSRGELTDKHLTNGQDTHAAQNRSIHAMSKITHQINQLCPSRWVDVFCISRAIVKLIEEVFDENTLTDTVGDVQQEVESYLNVSLEDADEFWTSYDVDLWLRCGFCNLITSDRAMFKVLDKLCTGQYVIPLMRALCVAYIILVEQQLKHDKADQPRSQIVMSDELQMRLVTRVIETTWMKMKGGGGHKAFVDYCH